MGAGVDTRGEGSCAWGAGGGGVTTIGGSVTRRAAGGRGGVGTGGSTTTTTSSSTVTPRGALAGSTTTGGGVCVSVGCGCSTGGQSDQNGEKKSGCAFPGALGLSDAGAFGFS